MGGKVAKTVGWQNNWTTKKRPDDQKPTQKV
jgi:hypothetical protein